MPLEWLVDSRTKQDVHWQEFKRIFRYLSGTSDFGLCYHGEDLCLTRLRDTDMASEEDWRKSISGYEILLGGGVIS